MHDKLRDNQAVKCFFFYDYRSQQAIHMHNVVLVMAAKLDILLQVKVKRTESSEHLFHQHTSCLCICERLYTCTKKK